MNLTANGRIPPKGSPAIWQCAVGFVNGFSKRCFRICAASGRSGASSGLKSARTLRVYLLKVLRSSPGTLNVPKPGPYKRAISADGVGSTCHSPERSGLPFTRGAGADRLGLPSRVRGMPGVGECIHCACTPLESSAHRTNRHECLISKCYCTAAEAAASAPARPLLTVAVLCLHPVPAQNRARSKRPPTGLRSARPLGPMSELDSTERGLYPH